MLGAQCNFQRWRCESIKTQTRLSAEKSAVCVFSTFSSAPVFAEDVCCFSLLKQPTWILLFLVWAWSLHEADSVLYRFLRSSSLRQAWTPCWIPLILSVCVSTLRCPCRGGCWRRAGVHWSQSCWSLQSTTTEKRWTDCVTPNEKMLCLVPQCLNEPVLFPSGSAGFVGHVSSVFGSVPLRQLSAGGVSFSQRPVWGDGPVWDDPWGGEQLLLRNSGTNWCSSSQNETMRGFDNDS